MIEAINYSNKKGIYKDLYKTIDADKKKKEVSMASRPRKGIYKNLYKQIEEDKKIFQFKNEQEKKDFWRKYSSKILFYANNLGKILKPIM